MTSILSGSGAALLGCGLALAVATALATLLLVRLLRPLLQRYALARPNARSAHVTPTPQGGGLAVLGAVIPAAWLGAAVLGAQGPAGLGFGEGSRFAVDVFDLARLWTVLGAAVLVGAVGVVDDIRPLPPLPRLALQIIAMGLAVSALPDGARVLPWMPLALERLLLVVGGAWFVNLTNFMDGMDWLTVADAVPATAALSLFWFFGFLSPPAGLAMLALLGGLLGFAPFNRPVARLFLGDVGSLSIGLLLAYGLFDLATHGGLAAAVLLVLYPSPTAASRSCGGCGGATGCGRRIASTSTRSRQPAASPSAKSCSACSSPTSPSWLSPGRAFGRATASCRGSTSCSAPAPWRCCCGTSPGTTEAGGRPAGRGPPIGLEPRRGRW